MGIISEFNNLPGIGKYLFIFLILLVLAYYVLLIWTLVNIIKNKGGSFWITIGILNIILSLIPIISYIWFIPAIIFTIIWWTNKENREIRNFEKKELRKAQLKALKGSKVKTKLKGKMRKLK